LGFNFNYYTFRANLTRIIALFKVPVDPYASSAIHIMQLTIPATGKSTTMYKLSNILNLEVISGGLPSSAKLIYNASSQEFGLVFTRDYIVIDEFDKSLNNKSEAYDFFSKIEMGMANGKWTREKYTKRQISEIRKDTTLIFFGNLEGKLLSEAPNTRMYLKNY
jgi:Predicted ATP-dependent Lon-type protease